MMPSVLVSHWTVGFGVPVAAAVMEADMPAMNILFRGDGRSLSRGHVYREGGRAGHCRSGRAEVLVKTAWYCVPLWV